MPSQPETRMPDRTEARTCAGRGCDVDLTGTHRRTKWCSARCRRRTEYTNICECGAEIYDGSTEPPTVCRECKHEARYGERNRRLVEMWEADEPTWFIAEQLGMSESAVRAWANMARRIHGRDLPLRRHRDRDRWSEIEKLWRKGLTASEIGERIGLSRNDVSARVHNMRKAGIDMPRRR